MTFAAIVHESEEGGFWAEVPALPGCMTEADTMEELKVNLSEAIQAWTETATELALEQAENHRVLSLAA
jgi:predicted RNase H-like HicB family nuclease